MTDNEYFLIKNFTLIKNSRREMEEVISTGLPNKEIKLLQKEIKSKLYELERKMINYIKLEGDG